LGSEREVGERDFKKREPYDAKGACLAKPNRNFHPRRARQNKHPPFPLRHSHTSSYPLNLTPKIQRNGLAICETRARIFPAYLKPLKIQRKRRAISDIRVSKILAYTEVRGFCETRNSANLTMLYLDFIKWILPFCIEPPTRT